jgi:plastocyanin
MPFRLSRLIFWTGFLILGALVLLVPIPFGPNLPANQVFKVQASRFAYTPSVLKVNPGDQVTIELTSMDVVHGLSIDGYALEISADPGQTTQLSFTANSSGSFRLRCSVTCGNMHPFMIGKLQVGNNDLLWRSMGLVILLVVAVTWKGMSR